jgi:hypothetical protein
MADFNMTKFKAELRKDIYRGVFAFSLFVGGGTTLVMGAFTGATKYMSTADNDPAVRAAALESLPPMRKTFELVTALTLLGAATTLVMKKKNFAPGVTDYK